MRRRYGRNRRLTGLGTLAYDRSCAGGSWMRIFLTFASEQQGVADAILLALRNRGHEVFFSHDDLPPGESFDARIQKAIARSDLLIFLVSPECVTRGRYTLTELSFARDQWPSPRGRVLPVLVGPTGMASVPNYLKAVTVLEPEGNIAAETAAAVDRLRDRSRSRSVRMFALLGLGTGVLSYLAYEFPLRLLMVSFLLKTTPGPDPTTPLPGVIFGLLVAACTYWYGTRDRFLLGVAFGFTVLAWILAYDSTAVVYGQLALYKKPPPISTSAEPASGAQKQETDAHARGDAASDSEKAESEETPPERKEARLIPFLAGMSGIVGGLVGGFVTVFGVSIANQRFRRFDFWTTTILLAGVLGTLMELARIERHLGFLLLFAIWQAAVISLIARGMAVGDDPETAS